MQVFEALIAWAVSCIIQTTTTFLNHTQNFVLFVTYWEMMEKKKFKSSSWIYLNLQFSYKNIHYCCFKGYLSLFRSELHMFHHRTHTD